MEQRIHGDLKGYHSSKRCYHLLDGCQDTLLHENFRIVQSYDNSDPVMCYLDNSIYGVPLPVGHLHRIAILCSWIKLF